MDMDAFCVYLEGYYCDMLVIFACLCRLALARYLQTSYKVLVQACWRGFLQVRNVANAYILPSDVAEYGRNLTNEVFEFTTVCPVGL